MSDTAPRKEGQIPVRRLERLTGTWPAAPSVSLFEAFVAGCGKSVPKEPGHLAANAEQRVALYKGRIIDKSGSNPTGALLLQRRGDPSIASRIVARSQPAYSNWYYTVAEPSGLSPVVTYYGLGG